MSVEKLTIDVSNADLLKLGFVTYSFAKLQSASTCQAIPSKLTK